ncbi:MAG: hypothetical protein WBV82_06520 [Myxococcaceae bacterium]
MNATLPLMLVALALAASPLRWDVPQGLYDHFHRAFVKAGLHVPPPEQQLKLDGQIMLTAFDSATETSYSVILQPYASGNTLVILGEASFAGRRIAPSQDTFAPLFPGAGQVVTSRLEGAELLSYAVRAQPHEVLTFYREVLPGLGFSLEEDGAFSRADEVVQVRVMPRQGSRTEVALTRTRR